MADIIVNQIVKCRWAGFLDQIQEGAEGVLVETDRKRAITRLIELLDETDYEDARMSVVEIIAGLTQARYI